MEIRAIAQVTIAIAIHSSASCHTDNIGKELWRRLHSIGVGRPPLSSYSVRRFSAEASSHREGPTEEDPERAGRRMWQPLGSAGATRTHKALSCMGKPSRESEETYH